MIIASLITWDKLLETLPVTLAMRFLLSAPFFFNFLIVMFVNAVDGPSVFLTHCSAAFIWSIIIWSAYDGWYSDSGSLTWELKLYFVILNRMRERCLSCNMPLLLWYPFTIYPSRHWGRMFVSQSIQVVWYLNQTSFSHRMYLTKNTPMAQNCVFCTVNVPECVCVCVCVWIILQ